MDLGLADWLSRLGPLELVEVLRDVLAAEANRVGSGPSVVHFSREVNRRDGGVDGTTDLPADARPIFCPGPRTWQVKSGAGPGIDISSKPRTREHLASGRDYVLCWSGDDPTTPKQEDVEAELREWIGAHYPGRTATVLTVPDLIRMVEHTPAVVHRHGGPLFLGYTVEEWGRRLRVEAYPFVSDSARDDVMAGLRAHSRSIPSRTVAATCSATQVSASYASCSKPSTSMACARSPRSSATFTRSTTRPCARR